MTVTQSSPPIATPTTISKSTVVAVAYFPATHPQLTHA